MCESRIWGVDILPPMRYICFMRAKVNQYELEREGQWRQLLLDEFDIFGIKLASALHGRDLTEEQINSTIALYLAAEDLGVDIWP